MKKVHSLPHGHTPPARFELASEKLITSGPE